MSLIQDMARVAQRYRVLGAEPEAFLCGKGAILTWDAEVQTYTAGYKDKTKQLNHREFMGIPVLLSRTASAERVELVMRRRGAPATVEVLRL